LTGPPGQNEIDTDRSHGSSTMRVPRYTQIQAILRPGSTQVPPDPAPVSGYDGTPFVVSTDHDIVTISAPWPDAAARRADDAPALLRLVLGSARRSGLFGARGRSWCDLYLGSAERPHDRGVLLRAGLTDTRQLAAEARLSPLIPVIEAAFIAFAALVPQLAAQHAAEHQAERLAGAVRQKAEAEAQQAALAHDLARFVNAEWQAEAPVMVTSSTNEQRQLGRRDPAGSGGDRRVSLATDGRFRVIPAIGPLQVQDYRVSDTFSTVHTLLESAPGRLEPALLEIGTPDRSDLARIKPNRAVIVYRGRRVDFGRLGEIREPGLRGLAATMLRARDVALTSVLAAHASMAASPESFGSRSNTPLIPAQLVRIPVALPIDPERPRTVIFCQLTDGSWASDAVVAVSRGLRGRKIYAEAIHLPAPGAPALADPAALSRLAPLHLEPAHLRPLFDLPPTILAWTASAEIPGGLVPTADPALWDTHYVRRAVALQLAASEAVPLDHAGRS
jgi:hypothetical protein